MATLTPRRRLTAIAHPRGVLILTAALFVALAALAGLAGRWSADVVVRDVVLDLASPAVIVAMRVVNAAGDWRLLLPATLALMALPRARTRWWLWIALMIAAAAVPDVVKVVVGRPRPEGASLGFPSGHATAAAAFFGAVSYLAGSLSGRACLIVRAASVVVIVLVAIARVVLRAHWPSDAVGGMALGLVLASAAAMLDASRAARPPAADPGATSCARSAP